MFGLGFQELIPIVLLLVIIFGAKRLPDIGSGIGKGIKNFKKSLSETENDKIEDDTNNEKKDNSE